MEDAVAVAAVNQKDKTIHITDDDGLSKRIVMLGTGSTPKKGDKVRIVVFVRSDKLTHIPK